MSMDAEIGAWLEQYARRLGPASRSVLARQLARGLRDRQARRIASQQNPDGSAFAQRKSRLGHKPLRAMFAKLRRPGHLTVMSDASGLSVGFSGRDARIARVHQEGLVDAVAPGGPTASYARRQLLGFSHDDVDYIMTTVEEWMRR